VGAADPPFAVVRALPVRGPEGSKRLPFLFIESIDGAVSWHREALVYANASVVAYDLASIERDVEIIGRFYDFFRVFWQRGALPEDALDYLVYAYLVWRHNGTIAEGASRFGGLRWKPLAVEALRSEFKALVRYFRFSSRTWGHVSLGEAQRALGVDGTPLRRMTAAVALGERDFLVHLAASREYWARHFGIEILMPPVATAARGGEGASLRAVMPEEEVWELIESERNPVYRALWLVGGFGGIRISEQLNAWQVDVLPGSYRRLAFAYEGGDDILFLRADPVRSRYIGDIGKPGPTRRQFLQEQYGMLPRKELGRSHPLYAGWKGTMYINGALLLSEVFWLNGRAARMFADCAGEIREFHRLHQTSKRHPFFYVNIADPTGEFRGDILKISNVESAWDRACLRCGLEPHRWGRSIHGLRHFYKALAKSLGISRDELQIMMGHKRAESQDDYGRTGREVAARLAEARLQRQSRIGHQA
jgi:integrase